MAKARTAKAKTRRKAKSTTRARARAATKSAARTPTRAKPRAAAKDVKGKYIYLAQMDIPSELESEFNRIYDHQHVPEILKVPGVRSCARYRLESCTREGMPRYAALYELDSADVINKPEWRTAADKGEWKPKIRPHTLNRLHCLYRKLP